ncbi:hypothetical protein MY4824_002629 [Beauveria thailandica]
MASVDWETLNKNLWDERAPLHAASPDYNVRDFLTNPSYISSVVAFDAPLLGPLAGLRCAHLQCHIGTDTLSLARRGAASVVGLDFSSASLNEARRLAAATSSSGGDKLDFFEASVYDALRVLPNAEFDLVFTGIGALCWIPDIREWAAVVAGLLKKGGRLFLREGHPMLWAVDDKVDNGRLVVKYPYFERGGEALLLQDEGSTYVQHEEHVFEHTASAEFNHGLGEILQALLDAGLRVTGLKEHQSVPWEAIPGEMEDIGQGESPHIGAVCLHSLPRFAGQRKRKLTSAGEYALKSEGWRLPLSYTLQAIKE